MITDSDIKKLKIIFATKKDLNKFATKDDLKRFATKDDLKRFATKDDLKLYATKEDMQKGFDDMLDFISSGFNRIEIALKQIKEHTDILSNHERRLDRLEDKVFSAS